MGWKVRKDKRDWDIRINDLRPLDFRMFQDLRGNEDSVLLLR